MRAVAELALQLLDILTSSNTQLATSILSSSKIRKIPPIELLGLLSNTRHYRKVLGNSYEELHAFTLDRLDEEDWTQSEIEEIKTLLQKEY